MAVDDALLDQDRQQLHRLGYAQELRRGLSTFSNFAISFTIISILAGNLTTFYLGMQAGGPRNILIQWPIVGAFSTLVAMGMAEVCSAYPTAGGLYYWSAKLAKRNQAGWSWFTGWVNFIGLVGVVASVDYALATFTAYFINFYDTRFLWFSNTFDAECIMFIYAVILLIHGGLNVFGVRLVKLLSDVSVWWHVIGATIIVVALLAIPGNTEGWSSLGDAKNLTGWGFPGAYWLYVFPIGMLLSQYMLTGYDASAHVSEETKGAATAAAKGMVRSVWISALIAWVMTVIMIQAVPKGAYDKIALIGINSAPELFNQSVGGNVAKLMIFVAVAGQFFCGMCGVTSLSRMTYAFSRDGGIPGHRLWHRINPKTRTPTNSVWFGVLVCGVVGCLSLVQNKNYSVAFFAFVAITAIGLYTAYVTPVFLRLRNKDFVPGPWNLGKWSRLVGWTAVIWVVIIDILFVLPQYGPLHVFWPPWNGDKVNAFNFAGPIFILALLLVWIWWRVSAHKWFKGPQVQGSADELAAIERELAAIERGEDPTKFIELEQQLEEELEEHLHPSGGADGG
ncbi:MAG TPA: amino acid permease [Acidimicrobiia bacterium]|nr:amino acid permease [Acidimicrobiia bacterium]